MKYALALLLTCSIACGEMRDVGVLRGLTPREVDRDTNGELSTMDSTLLADARLWLPMSKEFVAGNYEDASTNVNDGTQGTAGFRPAFTNGFGGAYEFDGGDDFISVTDHASLDFGTGTLFSCVAWVKLDVSLTQGVFDKTRQGSGPIQGFSWHYNAGVNSMRMTFLTASEGAITVDGSTNIDDGNWHHVAFVLEQRDGTSTTDDFAIYIDGVVESISIAGPAATNDLSNALSLTIAARNVSGSIVNNLQGTVDDPRIYDRALTSNEVFTIHADTTGVH